MSRSFDGSIIRDTVCRTFQFIGYDAMKVRIILMASDEILGKRKSLCKGFALPPQIEKIEKMMEDKCVHDGVKMRHPKSRNEQNEIALDGMEDIERDEVFDTHHEAAISKESTDAYLAGIDIVVDEVIYVDEHNRGTEDESLPADERIERDRTDSRLYDMILRHHVGETAEKLYCILFLLFRIIKVE